MKHVVIIPLPLVWAVACSSPGALQVVDAAPADAHDVDAIVDANVDAGEAGMAPPDAPPSPDANLGELIALCGAIPTTFDDWERCYLKRRCEWQVNCAGNGYRDAEECIDRDDDVSGGRLAAERRDRYQAISHQRARIDIEAFARCLIETSPARCNTALFHPSCATRFTGMVADGQACTANVECVSPRGQCEKACPDACCQGVCKPAFKEGERCTEYASCEPGLQCNGVTGYCIKGDIGTPCGAGPDRGNGDCDPDAWCDAEDGICEADLPTGATCTNLLQCGGESHCVGRATGDEIGQCLRVTEPGDPCDLDCLGNLYCDTSNPQSEIGVCRALPEVGEGCSVGCSGPDTICIGGRCARRGGEGATCSEDSCMPGLFCSIRRGDALPGRCLARGGVGDRCASPAHPEQCESHVCGSNGTCLAWNETCSAVDP